MKINIEPIATLHSPFSGKFGIPRQPMLAPSVKSWIEFLPPYNVNAAVRGLETVSHIWIIWQFSEFANKKWNATVRPPRFGGNKRVGVFATRSPLRPNNLALSAVKIDKIDLDDTKRGPIIEISGADIMDGSPIFDIKPYIPFTDCIAQASATFYTKPKTLAQVKFLDNTTQTIDNQTIKSITEILLQDPRPAYKNDAMEIFAFEFGDFHIEFSVENNVAIVSKLEKYR